MIIGQIVHDIIGPTGVLTSTRDEVGLNGTVTSEEAGYNEYKVKITQDLVIKANVSSFKKLGIQAPSGTVALINNKRIQIGRSEVYELDDDDIPIKSLLFENEDISNLIIDYTA